MEFNKQQLEIIKNIRGAFLISAPVGTGKTTVLSERVVRALEEGIKPEEILCLTFTNRAAGEMKSRLRKSIKDPSVFSKISAMTFHGFCAYFVRAEAKQLGIDPDFSIFDDEEQTDVMERIVELFPGFFDPGSHKRKQELRDMIDAVYRYRLGIVYEMIGWKSPVAPSDELKSISSAYYKALRDQNALDFNGLILIVLEALYFDEELKRKWSHRYRFIQLDEFQDTHVSEYLVLKQLAREHKNIAFIGDMDQTIYSWRGSDPAYIAGQFKKHFAPVVESSLEVNYRFRPLLLEAVKSFLYNLSARHTGNIISSKMKTISDQKPVDVFFGHNFREEIDWTLENIAQLRKKEPNAKIAVLARGNFQISEAAKIFEQKGIGHITVDKFDFFRRQEVRDIFAYLKLLQNRFDLESAYRVAVRPARNIGSATLKTIREEGRKTGIKVSDFLNFRNYNLAEPFEKLIARWSKGRIIVFDTETTGTDPLVDDVVQIYAAEIVGGEQKGEFHAYLKNRKPVGFTESIHGISDEFLAREGREPREVLAELKDFIASDAVAGHNIVFDLSMVSENARRFGISFEFKEYYDSLSLARRLVEADNYRLGTLAEMFGLARATHSADDDVKATVGLFALLVGSASSREVGARKELFRKYSPKFIRLSSQIDDWIRIVEGARPHDAMLKIWEDSGLKEHYETDKERERRMRSIRTLFDFFREADDKDKAPAEAMREMLQFSSLGKQLDFLGLEQGNIPIVTVHQVKGLEFDYVFINGMNEFKFPIHSPDIEEEKRLFYVALTRAREKAYLSYSQFDDKGRPIQKSRFIDYIDSEYLNIIR